MLHITNGDCTRLGLERSGVPGVFASWPDVLHEGPTPLTADRDEWRRVRAGYLSSIGHGDEAETARNYALGDAALASWRDHDETVFWFEHDLYDQLLFIHHMGFLKAAGGRGAKGAEGADGAKGAEGAEGATGALSLVCGDTYLGPLKPEQFPPLFAARTAITDEQLDKGARAWAAFCAPDPAGLLDWTREDPALPFLAGAIRRHIEDYPDETTGLARSERQILQVLSEGDRTPEQAFVAASQLEERIFMGDASFWVIARRLIDAREPLIAADVDRERAEGVAGRISLPSGLLRITAAGRDVLAGRADHVALNGISRWLGGVRLSPDRLWRRTSRGQLRPGA